MLCSKHLCDAKLIALLFIFFNVLTKFDVKIAFLKRYILELSTLWWDCISRRERGRRGEGSTDEQPLSDKPPLIRCGETYSTW